MRSVFAERADARRRELNLSRSELARRLEVHPSVVSQALNEGRIPQRATVERWAEALETSVDWLLGLDSAPPGPSVAERRLLAISAILGATATDLETILDALKPFLHSAAEEHKSGAL